MLEFTLSQITLNVGHAILIGNVSIRGQSSSPNFTLNFPVDSEVAKTFTPGAKYVISFEPVIEEQTTSSTN